MGKRYEHEVSMEHELPQALGFTVTQPDGRNVYVDMSVHGGFGDFAFTASDENDTTRFFAYWTSESSIFIDIMKRLRSRAREQLVEDVARMHSVLAEMTMRGYTPTREGEGRMDEWTINWLLAKPSGEPQRYPMFSGGDDMLVVDATHEDGMHIASDRDMDGQREYTEVVIPDDELWRFAAGMIARSYSDDGRSYTQLTRFATSQYDNALTACLQ